MPTTITSAVILLISILYFSYKAYRKGFWLTLFGILGFVFAYTACFVLGLPLGAVLESMGINSIVAFPLGLALLFVVTMTVFSTLPKLIFPQLKQASQGQQFFGLILGVMLGGVIGLFTIWGVNTVSALLALDKQQVTTHPVANTSISDKVNTTPSTTLNTLPSTKQAADVLTDLASSFVTTTIHSGMDLVTSGSSHELAKAFIETPVEFTGAMKELASSDELKTFWQSEPVTLKMAQNDAGALLQEETFQALASLPGMQHILSSITREETAGESPQLYLAEKLTYVWRRMRYIRSDPRVVAIASDSRFKQLIAAQNPMALLANKQAQQLLKIVLEDNNMDGFDFVSDLDYSSAPVLFQQAVADSSQVVEARPEAVSSSPSDTVYRWRDDRGHFQYTTFDQIPLTKRDHAEKFAQ